MQQGNQRARKTVTRKPMCGENSSRNRAQTYGEGGEKKKLDVYY